MGGIGVAAVFGFIAGENLRGIDNLHGIAVDFLRPAAGDVGRPALRTAKIHSNIHTPVGVQVDIAVDLLREVKWLALTCGIVIPARKSQTLNIRISRLLDGAAFLHINAEVGAKITVVIQEVRLIAAHAIKNDFYIVGRHAEGNLISVRCIFQTLRL